MNTLNSKARTSFAIVLIGLAACLRLVPHLPNFTPLAAVALFAGFYLPKRYAVIVPLIALFVSDIAIGFYHPKMMFVVYASFVLIALLGVAARSFFFRSQSTVVHGGGRITLIIGATLLGSILFFLLTNGAVWAFGTMYPHTAAGLLASYVAGIPFYRATLAGDLFYVTMLFGIWEFASARWFDRCEGIATLAARRS